MSQKINLRAADRKVFTAAFDDGVLDIFISSVVLMFAVAVFLSPYLGDFWSVAIFLPLWGVLYLILRWVRKNLINPRIGVVKYGPIRRKKLTLFTGVMLVLNVIFLILSSVTAQMLISPGWMVTVIFSAIILISFSLAGYFLDLTRLYVYGIMLAGAIYVGEWLYQTYQVPHHGYPIVFGFSTVIIFLVGLIKFITLVRDNPLTTDEALLQE